LPEAVNKIIEFLVFLAGYICPSPASEAAAAAACIPDAVYVMQRAELANGLAKALANQNYPLIEYYNKAIQDLDHKYQTKATDCIKNECPCKKGKQ
jgi:3-methyladenine DNA glycosylase/8-oxoguanine DNA glycosylase